MREITVEPVTAPTADVRTLIAELDETLSRDYAPEHRHGLTLDAIFEPHVRFFIARIAGEPLGCGGVALFPTYAEVKRMYVRESARGQGIAQALLARIESETRTSALTTLRLETGDKQHAAIRLYERAGFKQCQAFGDYAMMPPATITTSIFFEKHLT